MPTVCWCQRQQYHTFAPITGLHRSDAAAVVVWMHVGLNIIRFVHQLYVHVLPGRLQCNQRLESSGGDPAK